MHIRVRHSAPSTIGRAAHREPPRLGSRRLAPPVAAAVFTLATPAVVFAHGQAPVEPTPAILLEGWSFTVDVWLPVILAALIYWVMYSQVNRLHPANPVPRGRLWSWMAGLGAIVLGLASPIEFYDTTLFSVHMVQHLLLTFLAAPLLVLAAPITLLLRWASPEARHRFILPVLESRVVRVVSYPMVAWVLFAGVMWFSHFSPLFDAALDDFGLHRLEHALYLVSSLLFWWPVVGADPSPHRLSYPARIMYLALGMPFSSLLGLVIFSASQPLYPHYVDLVRDWGPTVLEDQALAGGIMWVGGDGAFVLALILAVAAWLRHEERENRREDARLARRRASASAAAVSAASTSATARGTPAASASTPAASATAPDTGISGAGTPGAGASPPDAEDAQTAAAAGDGATAM
jgi:putative membrane protein